MTIINKNLKTLITDNINDIASGVRKDSNARLTLVTQLLEVQKSKKFDFLVDINSNQPNKESYVSDFKNLNQLNKVENYHLKLFFFSWGFFFFSFILFNLENHLSYF